MEGIEKLVRDITQDRKNAEGYSLNDLEIHTKYADEIWQDLEDEDGPIYFKSFIMEAIISDLYEIFWHVITTEKLWKGTKADLAKYDKRFDLVHSIRNDESHNPPKNPVKRLEVTIVHVNETKKALRGVYFSFKNAPKKAKKELYEIYKNKN